MSAGNRDNFSGDFVVTAPTGGYTKRGIYQLNGSEWVVARETAAAGDDCLVAAIMDQPVEASKNTGTGEAFGARKPVYVNSDNQADANQTGNNKLLGVVAAEAAGDSDATVWIRRGTTTDS